MTHTAYKIQAEVGPGGVLQLTTPLPAGTKVEIVVLASPPDELADLVDAARSSTEFWDNPLDDEDWNDA